MSRGLVGSADSRQRAVPSETTAPPPSDVDLIRGCRAGDADAWDALVGRYERLVFSVALRNGLEPEDAADVTQMTFVALLDSLSALRADERLSSWLMTVARRQAWRVRRRREVERPLATVTQVVDPLADWDRAACVHDALQQLAPPCRELLLALYFDPAEPSYAEVAARLGRSIGGIGPMRARCLQRMRALLGEDGPR
jgi:RNA polymerase sigma factor (sigma-70 family)